MKPTWTDSERQEVAQVFTEYWPRMQMPPMRLEAYFQALSPFPACIVKKALFEIFVTQREGFGPTPSKVVEMCREEQKEAVRRFELAVGKKRPPGPPAAKPADLADDQGFWEKRESHWDPKMRKFYQRARQKVARGQTNLVQL